MMLRPALSVLLLAPVAALADPAPLDRQVTDRLAATIAACWAPPPGLPAVTLGFALGPDGRPDPDSFRAIGAADDRAFSAAFRAVMRCAGAGFALPAAQYDAWKQVELTFPATPAGGIR